MKIKFFYGLILILTSLSLGAEPAESSLPRPKLVVGIVVDQMRWDYLYRYYDRYGDRGFKRLLKEGFTCENTQLNYLPINRIPQSFSLLQFFEFLESLFSLFILLISNYLYSSLFFEWSIVPLTTEFFPDTMSGLNII